MSTELIAALQALHQEHKKTITSGGPVDYEVLYKKAIKSTEFLIEEVKSKDKRINELQEYIWRLEMKGYHKEIGK